MASTRRAPTRGASTSHSGSHSGSRSGSRSPVDVDAPRLPGRSLLAALRRLGRGEPGVRLPDDQAGLDGQICAAFNEVAARIDALADDTAGLEAAISAGKTGHRLAGADLPGAWRDVRDRVDAGLAALADHGEALADVMAAVAAGELEPPVLDGPPRGDFLRHARVVDTMVARLAALVDEVGRVTSAVGGEGKLGAQARVRGARGRWRELLGSVNQLAATMTSQVRDFLDVTTAVARGDLSRKVTVEVQGELLAVKQRINTMIDQLSLFAVEVVRIGHEVGDGVLGGRVEVAGVAGIWADLLANINVLAGRLTDQVRGIARVVNAVASGDLGQRLELAARGELATLVDDVNHMIRSLAETTRVNQEQDWLKTNLARFTRMLQGQRGVQPLAAALLSELVPGLGAQQGAFYLVHVGGGERSLRRLAAYAAGREPPRELAFGEGLVGQAALERRRIVVDDLPPGYAPISSGLGQAHASALVVAPVLFEGEVKAVLELAGLRRFTPVELAFLEQFLESLGIVLASLEAQTITDGLLRREQGLAEALRRTNEALEHKAEQLATTSRYKSQFLANMSHELRTPLNSLLILSRQLADNREGNLDERQVLYARTIHQAGADLLELINEVLDLAKIESGTMHVEIGALDLGELREQLERTFRHVAEDRRLGFTISVAADLPAVIATDELRVKQVLRNLLANAFKFTATGGVRLEIAAAPAREPLISFAVHDSGIGVAEDQQALIFEAFQQADGTATRKYGGTGLGLAISRQIADRLGGELRVDSRPGAGSTFTLELPLVAARQAEPVLLEPTAAPAPAPAAAPPSAELAGRKVLVVDDDIRNSFALTGVLEQHGVSVVYAEHGREALTRLDEHPDIDLVLMDVMMPEMDGLEATRQLRARSGPASDGRSLPVIAVTAKAMPGDREQCLRAGASDYLSKPVDADRLVALLRTWLPA